MKKLKISNIISPGDCCSASIRLPVCLVQDWSTMYNVENKLYNVNKFMRGLRSFQVCYKAEREIITVRIRWLQSSSATDHNKYCCIYHDKIV